VRRAASPLTYREAKQQIGINKNKKKRFKLRERLYLTKLIVYLIAILKVQSLQLREGCFEDFTQN
jgi:hypothetical protein